MSKNVEMLLIFNNLINKLVTVNSKKDLKEIAIEFNNKFIGLNSEFELEDDYLIDGFFILYDEKVAQFFSQDELSLLETFDTNAYMMFAEGNTLSSLIDESIKMD